MLAANALYFNRRGTPVLKNISAGFEYGRFYGIIGPNGAGKTTLLNCLSNYLEPDRGGVTLNGQSLSSFPKRELAKQISFMVQSSKYVLPVTGSRFVSLGRWPYGDKLTRADWEKIEYWMKVTDTLKFCDKNINELSGGEQRRLLLARTLVQETPVILLDEPAAHFDLRQELNMFELLKQRQLLNGSMIVSVFHDVNLASRLCDELLVLKEGSLIARGRPDQIINENLISDVYGVSCKKAEAGEYLQFINI